MKQSGNHIGVVGERKFFATDNVDIALIEFAEAAFLSTLATKVETDLGNFERKVEVVFVFDDVTSQGDGVVETKSLGGIRGGFVAGFFDFVDLFFGVAAGFGKEDFATFDTGGFDIIIAVPSVGFGNFGFEVVEDKLCFWQEFGCARNRRSVNLFHISIITKKTRWVHGGR